ncbi:MAG: hypothetical protein H7332_05200 [Bdellovibrionales bacterium]|nr:hypothetical protein [Ramlibacter sp.]
MTTLKAKAGLKLKTAGTAVAPTKRKSETEKATRPEILLSATVQNAVAMDAWGKFAGESDLAQLIRGCREGFESVHAGDLRSVESMLYGQAMALQTIFTNLARRSAMNADECIHVADTYLRLALKAQAQCRLTLESLAEIKNPRPVAFVKQTNITNGPQQVINDASKYTRAHPRAGNSQIEKNEVLGHQHGDYLDTGAQDATGNADSHLAAVEAGHGATHG